MSGSIWLIMCDVAAKNEDAYLDWFHKVHIPEKLSRPGYTWAAHYEVVTVDGCVTTFRSDVPEANARGFVAFFGGEDTRTFLAPSPAQIKPTQSQLTREMMAMRIGSQSLIAAEEWRIENGDAPNYNILRIILCDVGSNDEDYGAWSIQKLAPHLQASPGFEVATKLLSTTNAAKHITIASSGSLDDTKASIANHPNDEWTTRVQDYQAHATGSPMIVRRIF